MSDNSHDNLGKHKVTTLLTQSHIDKINHVIKNKHTASQHLSNPIYNKMFPQLELPKEIIWRLAKLAEDTYILYPIENNRSPKIPSGILSYAILYEDPLSIYCFEHNAVFKRNDLKEQTSSFINFGHSSLGFIKEKHLFDRSIPANTRLRQAAKPVLLAGHLCFPSHSDPSNGGGTLLSWTTNSGHYRPTDHNALTNRIGFIKDILPIHKFIPFTDNKFS
ncbi:hypothetical protein ACGVWS_02430 [Enterobacteriaceae bacterium LUAb1]